MRARSAAVLLVVLGGCRHDAPRPEPQASALVAIEDAGAIATSDAGAGSSADAGPTACAPFAIDEATARKTLEAFPPITHALKTPKQRLFLLEKPSCKSPYFTGGAGDEGDAPGLVWDGYRVDARTGALEAESMCPSNEFLPAADWLREDALIDGIWDLPEVRGFGRMLLQASNGKVHMLIRADRCPSAGDAEKRYFYYVGEQHDDHTIRWNDFVIEPKSKAMWVVGYDDKFVPYALWKETAGAKKTAQTGFPDTGKGGALGYGPADKTVTDIAGWTHPAKKIVSELGDLERVELYVETYPVFFVKQAKETAPSLALANRLRAANSYWPYEIVLEPSGERFRHTGNAWETFAGDKWVRIAKVND